MPRKYGWVPDLPHPEDQERVYKVVHKAEVEAPLLPSVDLRPLCPPVYDQKQLGSCTAQAIAGLIEYDRHKQKLSNEELPDWVPSRLFIYYNERAIEGTISMDAGAQIRDGIKAVASLGAPPETEWPYVETKFARRPTKAAYSHALKHKAVTYARINNANLKEIQSCLAAGFPVVFGATLFASFESEDVARTGLVPMPRPGEAVIGGHAQLIVGYDDSKKSFLVRNSWGPDWGLAGYCWMPYDYLTNVGLADDFWTIRLVS